MKRKLCQNNRNKNQKKEDDLNQSKKIQGQESMKVKRRERKRRVEKTGTSIDDVSGNETIFQQIPFTLPKVFQWLKFAVNDINEILSRSSIC